ncbi:MAG: DUF6491 family protein [Alphaproteobacteria bacterium]
MRLSAFLLALALPAAVAACANSTPPPLEPVHANAFLPAEFGALQSWQALRDGSILLQGQDKKYIRAVFTAPCAGLANAPAVTLKTGKVGDISKVQGITVGAETCYFNALEPVDDPKSLAIASPSAPVEGRPLPAPTR